MKKTNLLIILFLSATIIEVSTEVVACIYSMSIHSIGYSSVFFKILTYLKYILDAGYIVPYILAKIFFFATLVEMIRQYIRKN